MLTIKIPSKNVFSTPDTKNLIKSKIKSCNGTSYTSNLQSGEISNYTIKLLSITPNDEAYYKVDIEYIGDDTTVNNVPFILIKDELATGDDAYRIATNGTNNPIIFNINEIADIRTLQDNSAYNIYYVETQTLYDVDTQKYEEYKVVKTPQFEDSQILRYNAKENPHILTYIKDKGVLRIDTNYGTNTHIVYGKLVTEVNIQIFGTYITNTEESFPYPSNVNGSSAFKLPTNELFQSDVSHLNIEMPYIEYLSNEVMKQYQNGKEVIELKCSVSDYYYTENNDVAISTIIEDKPMTFRKYDIVEPYIFTSKGEKPISVDNEGNPMKYQVLGVKFDFKGVVWQTLTLQSYTE